MKRILAHWPVALALAIGSAVVSFALLLEAGGADAGEVLRRFVVSSFGSRAAWTETLVKATPILFCAIAAALPARLGLVNIGAEGQLLLGAISATLLVRLVPHGSTSGTILLLAAGGLLGGAIWGLIPGFLRAFTGANETVISLLLNYVAGLLVLHFIHGPWKDPASLGWAQTADFPPALRLATVAGTRIHVLLVAALIAAALLAWVYRRTSWGFASRVVEASPIVARYAGLRVGWMIVAAFAVGGAFAGLAGFGEVAGIHGRLREGLSLGYGYTGFLVAWLCRGRFEWIPLASVALGGVIAAGDSLQVFSGLPFATTSILQGLLFIGILVMESMRARDLHLRSVA